LQAFLGRVPDLPMKNYRGDVGRFWDGELLISVMMGYFERSLSADKEGRAAR
jgi:hypothetical protein